MTNADLDASIIQHYGRPNPDHAYICGGQRIIAVDPLDARVRNMLLKKGRAYYSKNMYFIYKMIKDMPVDLYFDIGVNYGECLLSLPKNCQTTVVGYEANKSLMRYIESSISINDDIHDVSVKNLAMSSELGDPVTFYIDRKWSGKSSVLHKSDPERYHKVKVPVTTIENELMQFANVHLFLAKVDVEGFEPSVLRGLGKGYDTIENIVCLMEFDEKYLAKGGCTPSVFFNELLYKYDVYGLFPSGLKPASSYSALKDMVGESQRLHVDLVLAKLNQKRMLDTFNELFIGKNLRGDAKREWCV